MQLRELKINRRTTEMMGRGKATTVDIPKDILHKMKDFARFNKVLRSAIKFCAK
jgi:hypothetical protein